MEEHDAAGLDVAGGDERRAVSKACPGALSQIRRRLGQNLAFDENAISFRHAGEGAESGEIGKRLRFCPGERATECALTLAQRYRYQRIIGGGCGKARSGEANQRAAAGEPALQRHIGFLRQAADIGHDDDGWV